MWPRTPRGEVKQRALKRRKEACVLLEMLREELARGSRDTPSDILEFGAGAGYQAPWLGQLGNLVVSDVYLDRELSLPSGIPFVLADMARAPFGSEQFDLVFSNHVIEHLSDFEASFRELLRIGRPDCLYAFAVPTAFWVFLSVPVQYRDKARNIWSRIRHEVGAVPDVKTESLMNRVDRPVYDNGSLIRRRTWAWKLLPHGHGRFARFWEAAFGFRTASWRELFCRSGFVLVRDRAVLCYAPSGWPVIPPNRMLTRIGMCSSRLFLLRKMP